MDSNQYFHHYTNINSLALILKSKRLRFTRLDSVDDVSESYKFGKFPLAKYLFVSCWTDSDEESIPLWHMYSKGSEGVIITLPKNPFLYRPIEQHPILNYFSQGNNLSFLDLNEIFTNKYMINPMFLNEHNFIKKVDYLDNQEIKNKRDKAVQQIKDSIGRKYTQIESPAFLSGFKSKSWAFQNEVRYALMIFPSPPIPKDGISNPNWITEVLGTVIESIINEKEIGIDHLDINLDSKAIDKMQITLSPFASESDQIIVDTLLKQFTHGGSWSLSHLTNLIRRNK